jgi:hypothetical protein
MQKISVLLLTILFCSCSRTVYSVAYHNVCGSQENFIYTTKETNLSYQTFNIFGGYYEGTDPPNRWAIVKINIQNNLEEEIYLFKELLPYYWDALDVTESRNRIAVVLTDTTTKLCIISREEDRIIEKIEGVKNPCFFPDADSLLYEKNNQIFVYSIISGSERLFVEEGCTPRIDREANKMVYKRGTQIVLLNLSDFKESILVDTARASNPDISPDGLKIIYSAYDTSGTRTFFLIDTLGTALDKYVAEGAYIPKHWAINPYPYFVGNDKFVYRAYSENVPLKILYLQELTSNSPVLVRQEFKTYYPEEEE